MTTSHPRVLALIPARGGSKGLPRKNVLPISGKPMISWSILAALQAECVTDVVLSSDDDEIMDIATRYGCDVPFRRPADLASDTATLVDVVLHALDVLPSHGYLKYDYVLLLQPTSPLRTSADIDGAFELMRLKEARSCVSVYDPCVSPFLMFELAADSRISPVIPTKGVSLRRQDLPPTYKLNGAIYFAMPNHLRNTKSFINDTTIGYVMPDDRSADIDTRADFEIVQRHLDEKINKGKKT